MKTEPNIASGRIDAFQVGRWLACVLFAKVMFSILYEYRWYFPANFDQAAFLIGHEQTFFGTYSVAFYTHIVCGPLALLNAGFLMFGDKRIAGQKLHRRLGRTQILLVLFVTVSGVLMARRTIAGPVAGIGFTVLAACTLGTAVAAAYYGMKKAIGVHQQWATRGFILLCSPLLLRLISGASIVMELESTQFYRANAWLSWLLPWGIYEVAIQTKVSRSRARASKFQSLITEGIER